MSGEVVKIGDPHGRIAIYYNEQQAWDLAARADTTFSREIVAAIDKAYPKCARTDRQSAPLPCSKELEHDGPCYFFS